MASFLDFWSSDLIKTLTMFLWTTFVLVFTWFQSNHSVYYIIYLGINVIYRTGLGPNKFSTIWASSTRPRVEFLMAYDGALTLSQETTRLYRNQWKYLRDVFFKVTVDVAIPFKSNIFISENKPKFKEPVLSWLYTKQGRFRSFYPRFLVAWNVCSNTFFFMFTKENYSRIYAKFLILH